MARQRIINPEFWLDYEISSSENSDMPLFYIGTWTFCDDYGVIEDNAPKLKAQIFPYRNIKIESLRDELVKIGKLIPFEAEDKKWLYIKNFLKYQKIDRPSKFRNPKAPFDEPSTSPRDEEKRREEKRSEEKRREENAREGESTRQRANTSSLDILENTKSNVVSARKGKPYFWDQQMRFSQSRWWVLPKEGGAWKEFTGKESEIEWRKK